MDHWRLREKNESQSADGFFYAFVRLNERKSPPEYWVVSSKIVSDLIKKRHQLWLKAPGKKGQAHNDNPGRTFTVKFDEFFPKEFSLEEINQGYNSLKPILEFEKEK